MNGVLGIGLMALGVGLAVFGWNTRRTQKPADVGTIRPEFTAVGEIMRPLLLCAVAAFALKMTTFYFLFGGRQYLSPLDFAGILFVLAGYATYVMLVIRRPQPAPDHVEQKPQVDIRSAA